MHTRESIWQDLKTIGILPSDTVLIHSSLKAVGEMEGRGEGLLQALIDYFVPGGGLLIFPAHSWATVTKERPVFLAEKEPACVGTLPNLALRHPDAVRSLHPTHSVVAFGKDAAAYVAGEERCNTPCPPMGCWCRLIYRKAKILLLGSPAAANTFLHAVEEMCHVPERLDPVGFPCVVIAPDGTQYPRIQHPHINHISVYYDLLMPWLMENGAAFTGKVGDALTYVQDAAEVFRLTAQRLSEDPDLFITLGKAAGRI